MMGTITGECWMWGWQVAHIRHLGISEPWAAEAQLGRVQLQTLSVVLVPGLAAMNIRVLQETFFSFCLLAALWFQTQGGPGQSGPTDSSRALLKLSANCSEQECLQSSHMGSGAGVLLLLPFQGW